MLYLSSKDGYYARAEDIARDMQIPKSFLRKILKQLEKSGLVKLKRGVSGGINLMKNPEEITLYDVIVAMEKNVALNRCVINKKICGLLTQCPVHPTWLQIRQKLIDSLKEIKFHDLAMRGTAL